MNFYSVFKTIAFKFDAEQIHEFTLNLLSKAPQFSEFFSPLRPNPSLALTVGDLSWKFPVGVAAGFDKNAQCIPFFQNIGFGAIEVGTITKQAQIGNPRPRVFRLPEINSVRNAMGFPNAGSEVILHNIKRHFPYQICLGSNIGKNKETSELQTPQEYADLYEMFAPVSDYIVINISSPNTPGLRSFQKKELLTPILDAVDEKRKYFPKPIYIKIAPDLADEDLIMLCELSKEKKFSGIVATNTTIQHEYGVGGLSGRYIKDISSEIRRKTCEILKEDPDQSVIGVGGIENYQQIKEFWKQGGGFVQVYTSFIYHGPSMLKQIQKDILKDMNKYQFRDLSEMYQNITKVD